MAIQDSELQEAFALSLLDDPARDRCARANAVLQHLGHVRCGESAFALSVDPVMGDGFCWYRCLTTQANLHNDSDCDVELLAAYALAALAQSPERRYSNDSAEEGAARRRCLLAIHEYTGVVHELDDFDIYILDKMEGVMQKDMSQERRYADEPEMNAVLTCLGLRAAIVDVDTGIGGVPCISLLPDMTLCTSEQLCAAEFDALFVHYQMPNHYDSVVGIGQQLWAMPAVKCAALVAMLNAWQDLPALRAALYNTTQSLMRAARLEMVGFVLQQKHLFRMFPELTSWFEWKAFAATYNFSVAAKQSELDAPQRWLSENCRELVGEPLRLYAEVLQWFFGPSYVLFAAIRSGDLSTFSELCRSSLRRGHIADSDVCLACAQRLFSQSAVAMVESVHSLSVPAAVASLSFRGMRFASVDGIESVVASMSHGTQDHPFSCSKLASVSMRFMDPRHDEASVLTMRLKRRRLNAQPYQCGLLMIFDGIPAVDVSSLNSTTVGEHEVWLTHCDMFVAFRDHDPYVLRRALGEPLPITGRRLAAQDVEELFRCASAVRLDVVVLTPTRVTWNVSACSAVLKSRPDPCCPELANEGARDDHEADKEERVYCGSTVLIADAAHNQQETGDAAHAVDPLDPFNDMAIMLASEGGTVYVNSLPYAATASLQFDALFAESSNGYTDHVHVSSGDVFQQPPSPKQKGDALGGGCAPIRPDGSPQDDDDVEATGRKHAQWMSMFSLQVCPDRLRKPDEDLRHEAAQSIAKHLREHVTLPADPQNPQLSWKDVESGGLLPVVSCAFQNCPWSCEGRVSDERAFRSDCEHPWDQLLRAHVLASHGQLIRTLATDAVGHGQACADSWDLYKAACSVRARDTIPIVGASTERRVFEYTAHVFNDQRIKSLMCFACPQIKVDMGGIRSDIEFRNARWLFTLPKGSFTKNFSSAVFAERYRKPGSPLAHSGDSSASAASAEFADWELLIHPELQDRLQQQEAGLAGVPLDELEQFYHTPVLCCPEDQTCRFDCKALGLLCPFCEVPICRECQLVLQQNKIIPHGLINDNWYGYLQSWVYEVGVTSDRVEESLDISMSCTHTHTHTHTHT